MLLLGCDKAENKRENYARDGSSKHNNNNTNYIYGYRVEVIIREKQR